MVVVIFKLVFEFLEGVIIAQIAGPSQFMVLSLVGKFMLSKSLIQFSACGWGYVASLYFGLRPSPAKDLCQHAALPRTPVACARPFGRPLLAHTST